MAKAQQTQTQPDNDFGAAKVQEKPQVACTGMVNPSDISEPKETQSGVYYLSTVKFSGTRGSQSMTTNFMFQPEWFEPNFNPESLNGKIDDGNGGEKNDGRYFVFGKNINKTGEISVLTALCGGTDDHRRAFRGELNAARTANNAPLSAEQIIGVLKQFVEAHQEEVGYILKQATEETGNLTANGRKERRLLDKYEIGTFFEVTDEIVTAQEKRALKSAGKFLVGYQL